MYTRRWRSLAGTGFLYVLVLGQTGRPVAGALVLGPEELVKANGVDITVLGYSVLSFVDWNGDNLKDLVVGEGGSTPGKVCVYLNGGLPGNPQFSSYFYAQSNGADLSVPGGGCLGAFPRTVYWDADNRKDLIVGRSDGKVTLFSNVGTDDAPTFDAGTFLQVGQPGAKTDINVGGRATSIVVDWNSDGKKDLVVGGLDGRVRVFVNEGTDTSPDFHVQAFAQANGADLSVPSGRSSPVILDLDDDGQKDLLTGNTDGQLLLYSNIGSDEAPSFDGYTAVESDGVPIDLPGIPRSRPFVCDWTGDGLLDVLIGAGDGKVHLYQGVPEPSALVMLVFATLGLRIRCCRRLG